MLKSFVPWTCIQWMAIVYLNCKLSVECEIECMSSQTSECENAFAYMWGYIIF